MGVRKGDSECSEVVFAEAEEEGNWEKRWRVDALLGERGIAEVERRSDRWAKAFCVGHEKHLGDI